MLQDLSTSENPTAHISLGNINPQCSYYQPKRKHGTLEDQITNEGAGQDVEAETKEGFQLDGASSLEDDADLTISYRPGGTVTTGMYQDTSVRFHNVVWVVSDYVP